MAVSKRASAVPRKAAAAAAAARKTAANRRTNQVENLVGTTADPVYVRHQALSYARSLFPNPGGGPNDKPLSASVLITAAAKLESYMLNGRSASAATSEDES